MFGGKKKPKATARIETLIGQQTEIRGDVVFHGGLHVDGTVKGNVIAEGGAESVLSLSERGTIEGEVRVPNVMINGTPRNFSYQVIIFDPATGGGSFMVYLPLVSRS